MHKTVDFYLGVCILGLSKDPSKPTHPLLPTEPDLPPTESTAPAVSR